MDGPKRRLERLACDRCHRQKLRCSRASHSSRACQRCVKAGERCTYSPPLRLGRPAIGSRPGGPARRPSSACKRNEKDRHQASPPTPITPPTITVASHAHDSFETSADASRPPTPPVCLDAGTGFDACHEQALNTAAMTPLSASPIFAAMPDSLSSDYLITPTSTTGLDSCGDEAFLMAELDSDYPNDGLPASMLLDMCTEQPDYLITPASTTDDFCLYPTDSCQPETLMAEDGRRPGSHDGPERQLLKLQQSLDGLQKTIDLATRASDMLLSNMMNLMTSNSTRLSCSSRSVLDQSRAPASSGCRPHMTDLAGVTVNSEATGLESHMKNVLNATLETFGNQHGHGMYYAME